MANNVYRQGNALIVEDASGNVEFSPHAINVLIQPVPAIPGEFAFLTPDIYVDSTGMVEFTRINITDLQDIDSNPYTTASFIEFYTTNTGEATTISPVTPESGLVDFYISPIGIVGSGVGQADPGFIGNVPVILFDKSSEEEQVTTFKVLSRILLDTVDPVVRFVIYSTALPVLTTGDSIRWQLDVRNIAEDEDATKSPDESLVFTQTFPYLRVDGRQSDLSFTLDRTLMTNQDSMHFTLIRIAGDVSDNYNADVGVSESDINLVVTPFNP